MDNEETKNAGAALATVAASVAAATGTARDSVTIDLRFGDAPEWTVRVGITSPAGGRRPPRSVTSWGAADTLEAAAEAVIEDVTIWRELWAGDPDA